MSAVFEHNNIMILDGYREVLKNYQKKFNVFF